MIKIIKQIFGILLIMFGIINPLIIEPFYGGIVSGLAFAYFGLSIIKETI